MAKTVHYTTDGVETWSNAELEGVDGACFWVSETASGRLIGKVMPEDAAGVAAAKARAESLADSAQAQIDAGPEPEPDYDAIAAAIEASAGEGEGEDED
jgi:hypothetical protein